MVLTVSGLSLVKGSMLVLGVFGVYLKVVYQLDLLIYFVALFIQLCCHLSFPVACSC